MAKEYFKPINMTICDVFSVNGIYKIPDYQRQYSWTNDQLDALWEDLYDAYQNKSVDNDCYFLGSIVYVNNGKGYLELIDGQQRITTLMIMMNVLLKDFPDVNGDTDEIFVADKDKIQDCVLYNKKANRLQLQNDPKYNVKFINLICERETFSNLEEPTKKQLKIDDPQYKYLNTAYYFYNKFNSLSKEDLNGFVNFIFFSTNIITIECTNQSFAIKLFQVMNDRGLDLSPSDIIKSYLIGKVEKDDGETLSQLNYCWKEIEDLSKEHDYKIDDFMVYYEYFKLRANPKRQVIDELRDIIQDDDIYTIIKEMTSLNDALKEVYNSKDPAVLALRYIPWKFYVMTALCSAIYVKYPDLESLYSSLRKYFYVAYVAGMNLNQIKQVSFNLIDAICDKRPIDEIEEMLQKNMVSKRMYAKFYDSIDNDVYGEKFLKPLLLSLEYYNRESLDETFYKVDNSIHLDHIMPQSFHTEEDWDYVDREKAYNYINKIGNLALLQNIKNEKALNCGFKKKMSIYKGLNKLDNNETGYSSFDTTIKLISDYEKKEKEWNIKDIEERQSWIISQLENMLDISREDINLVPSIEDSVSSRSSRAKWEYKGKRYTNKALIHELLKEYIEENDFKTLNDIPAQIRNYKMYSHELIVSCNNELVTKGFSYNKVNVNGMELCFRSVCQTPDTKVFLEFFKKYYLFEYNI